MSENEYEPEGPVAPIEVVDDVPRAEALRAGLAEYDLEEGDLALLESQGEAAGEGAALAPLPVLAVVGRPNVGKSTLVNRILGRREAVVEDTPGVTRDRVHYDAEWSGREFTLVDTGGWEVDVAGIEARVAEQAEVAISLADAVLFVVDATVGPTATDEQVVRLLRRSGKPVVLAANKVDGPSGESDAACGASGPASPTRSRRCTAAETCSTDPRVLPETSQAGARFPRVGRVVAIVGKPNVGKSSLLNQLAGEERVVVDNVAGTTVDPVDELITLKDRTWWFVDTAGIRRRVHQTSGADFYASLRTRAAIERSEVAVVLVDFGADHRAGHARDLQVVETGVRS